MKINHNTAISPPRFFSHYTVNDMLWLFAVALSYVFLAYIVLTHFSYNGVISLVWPSSGLAVAALLLGGKKYSLGVYVGSFVANLLVGSSLGVSLFIAVGNTAEVMLAAWLLVSIFSIDIKLMQPRDYFWLSIAGAIGSLVSAANGTLILLLSGFMTLEAFPQGFLNWWMGDVLGIMMMTPLILIWRYFPFDWLTRRRLLECALCVCGSVITGQAVFFGWFESSLGMVARDYWAFFFVCWGAIRFGSHGALLLVFITTLQALLSVSLGMGPLQIIEGSRSIILDVWFYIFVLTVVGVSLSLVIMARNMSEIRQRNSYERYRLVVENAPYAIAELDQYFTILSMNPSGVKMMGGSGNYSNALDLVSENDKQYVQAFFEDACAGKSSTYEFLAINGHTYESCFVPIGNKEYGHVMSITQDITKRKQAEKQEAEHAEIMTLIAKDETPIVIFERIVANLEARNTDLICSVLLLSEDGHCLMHAVAPSLPDFYNAAINGVEIGPNNGSCGVAAFTGELVIVEDISSHPYWMNYKHLAERAGVKSCWSQPFKGSDGRVLGTFAIYSRHVCAPTEVDIKQIVTASQLSAIVVERMLSQNQLQELNRTLESKVEERTRDLEAAKLEAEISNKAKSDFLSHMSHEIRTPMNSIIGMSYLALQNETHPKQRDYLQKIHYSGEHLLDLINNILDLSKIERSMLVLDKQSFALNKVTERLNTLFHLPAIEKGIELSFHLDPEIPTFLHGDLQHLNQVLVNLTGNALKFTSQGNVVIRAHLLSQDEQCCWVRFEVEDSGIGIKKDLQAKLFQPFVQGDSSITRIYGGTGLGLTISKKLIELMGGAVGLQSTLQKGTTFWFDIPLGVSDGALVDITNEDLIDYALLANAQILLAEDNLFNQQVAKGLLEYVGTKVVVASNGLEAIDLILKHELPFDCVLMDMQMPEMDGIEATRIIRRSSQGERLPIIALTANISKEDYDACYDVGMSDFISKPVSPLLLYATVCKWVRAQKKHT